ncbi:hypothetical protein [Pantoea sp. GM01]|uniref:hypothetical protein n=1 Tax=Pantoea sp. GM01 TaxID=1144320 RepID=UPI000270DA23|nr:hypothetical protein [Pantoea sp. GM01]EJL87997.1 hypothetical protein PMI17_02755 [Pantoea sp. GM01]
MDKNYKTVFLSESSSGLNSSIVDAGKNSFFFEKLLSESKVFSEVVNDIKINTNQTSSPIGSVFLNHNDGLERAIDTIVLKKQKMILTLLKSDDYVEGEITKTQLYFESMFAENPIVFRDVFQKTWLELFRKKNANELRKFICIASCLDYEALRDRADAIILAASVYEDKYVNEAALRAAEAWGDSQLALYLEGIRDFGIAWLDDYKRSVIDYLRRLP